MSKAKTDVAPAVDKPQNAAAEAVKAVIANLGTPSTDTREAAVVELAGGTIREDF